MKKLLFIVMACYGLNASAQLRQSEKFIYLYSDSVVYANNIRLRPDGFNSFQLRADSRRIPLAQVKFFSNEDGFFANTRKVTFGGVNSFSERFIEGKINLFQETTYEPYFYDRQYNYGYRSGLRSHVDVDARMFYNKGYADLKKVNYNNLRWDMADNEESMDFLKSYRKSMRTSTIMYAAAGGSVIAGLITFLGGNPDRSLTGKEFGNSIKKSIDGSNSRFAISSALLGIGLGFATGGYFIHAGGNRHLENAVDAYNR